MCDPVAWYWETVFIPAVITHAVIFLLLIAGAVIFGVIFCVACAWERRRK